MVPTRTTFLSPRRQQRPTACSHAFFQSILYRGSRMSSHRQENRTCHSQQKALRAVLRKKSISLLWPSRPAMVAALPAVTSRDTAPLLLPFHFGKLGLHVTACFSPFRSQLSRKAVLPTLFGLDFSFITALFCSLLKCLIVSEGFSGCFCLLGSVFSKHMSWAFPEGQDSALLFAVSLAPVWSLANSRRSTDTKCRSELIWKDRSENACSAFHKGELLPWLVGTYRGTLG